MNHAEISRNLALALGYYPESVYIDELGSCLVYRIEWKDLGFGVWRIFDYRDGSVAFPLLVWLTEAHGYKIEYTQSSEAGHMAYRASHPRAGINWWSSDLAKVIAGTIIAMSCDEECDEECE